MSSYPIENEIKYKDSFEKYPYELSIFQKYAIEGIIEEQHVLITAHTGSGKTLAGEFAIEYFVSKGKKVIYTAPIKSLINQKFYDFTQKYPHISFGILTGDIKFNPEADVLIMTAEILLNKLYQNTNNTICNNISFDMNLQTDLACVVMDEVHFVNDMDRGYVWESTIMMLPQHVQMVMLSATIDRPEKFAEWCENVHKNNSTNKQVYLTNTTHRVVPLTHYSFITVNQGIFKAIKDKAIHQEINSIINKPFVIQTSGGKFNDEHYFKMNKMLKLFESKDIRVKRGHVLNNVTKYMVENEMLPALCFVLSRKQLEVCANEITTPLLEFDSKVPYIIDRECEDIIRKLPNYQEYLHLPEYINMVALLRKGIAIHHSGIMPILKEIVELLYAKGYIKLLFATETFSVGVNMPTKSVIFTDVNKFDGNNNRSLYAHEYTQMAGRAGRRNIDKIGSVIHLNNLFRNVDSMNYKKMMNGKPQTLVSKFKISYNLLLNLLDNNTENETGNDNNNNLVNFTSKSMVTGDLESQMTEFSQKLNTLNIELHNINICISNLKTPKDVAEEYIDLQNKKAYAVNKKRKEIDRQISQIIDNYKNIESDKLIFQKLLIKENEIRETQQKYDNINSYIQTNINHVIDLLKENNFVEEENNKLKLSLKGKISTQLREIHCLVFAELIENKMIDQLSSKQLVALFSCFTNISVSDDYKDNFPRSNHDLVNDLVKKITNMYTDCQEKEIQCGLNTGMDYNIQYDLIDYVIKWCECEDIIDCKFILQQLISEKEIFLGEFVKALLKINNISSEMEKIAEFTGNIAFLNKLKEIPNMTLKFVVTNQSLYV